jgi:hypothetical protein
MRTCANITLDALSASGGEGGGEVASVLITLAHRMGEGSRVKAAIDHQQSTIN